MLPVLLACSGVGAEAAIERSTLIGLISLLLTVMLTAAAIRAWLPLNTALQRVAAGVGLVTILAHPSVWLGVSGGDCGYALRYVGPGFTVLHGLAAVFLIARRRRAG